ncbi:MAG: hypothetical protein UY74_C0043G0004 [Candidatus Kaiserbacteria bacterium GW2011_GWC2_52_8b]|uniref:Uncharacterized protein n=2 Tax=Candidatus Kaiseribacteriota TaxID=1752734 RepID=A0A0G1XHH0_9BACT|nr:MAG: hypothetical protein UY67_C0035G0004 [Candidatus Kaiserbacteria bacterium GW2011_GWA2_52_12]KKW30360.1 MAG: hypothetical protein UY74_C0043G0004 [Candidatus Kaiserbacteria bacterium GW2011_GWC2_52_8b]
MKLERAILLAFFANYLVNNVVAAVVALIPPSATPGILTPQYMSFVVLSALLVAAFTWWYMKKGGDLQMGVIFGVTGFLVAIITALVSGLAGVVLQTGSLSQMVSVLPNFWPFLANWSTIVLLGYWVIPAVAIGWYVGRSGMTNEPPKPIF